MLNVLMVLTLPLSRFMISLRRGRFDNGDRDVLWIRLAFLAAGKPHHGVLKIPKGSHRPAPQHADQREHPGAMMRIAGMEDGQTLVLHESEVLEGAHQRGQIR